MRKAVVDLASVHPAWSVPAASLDAVRQAFGDGWEVRVDPAPQSNGGVVLCRSGDDDFAFSGVEVYLGWGLPRKVVRGASGTLRWAHSGAAGVGNSLTAELRESGATLTNSRGIHAEPISDWVIAAIGFCTRGFHEAMAAQRAGRWGRSEMTSVEAGLTEFSGLRVGVVGLGGIGMAVARKCSALGMEVRAVRRQESVQRPDCVAWVGGTADLRELAAQSDVLVLALPHTTRTKGLIGVEVLQTLPRGAFVLNVSRGEILDEPALLDQLDSGHIRGCVLDVFAKEPLEPGHPFWEHPRVFVTPHASAVTNRFWMRETDLIVENVGRFLRGEPLLNVVNFEIGY